MADRFPSLHYKYFLLIYLLFIPQSPISPAHALSSPATPARHIERKGCSVADAFAPGFYEAKSVFEESKPVAIGCRLRPLVNALFSGLIEGRLATQWNPIF